jgi:hypothetical protein
MRELLTFRFGAGANERFDGLILGALERAESGGATRIVEVLVVARDRDSGEAWVLHERGGARGLVEAATSFRLDERRRRDATATVLAAEPAVAAVADALQPGEAVFVVLLEHRWRTALHDAVARAGGEVVGGEPVSDPQQVDLARQALACLSGSGPGSTRSATPR